MPKGTAERPPTKNECDAFEDAVADLINWERGVALREVSLDRKNYPIDAIFSLMTIFSDPAPDKLYNAVCNLAQQFRDGLESVGHECAGPEDHSYASVAHCALMLHQARKAHFKYEEQKWKDRDASGV